MTSQTTFRSNGNRAEEVGYGYDLRGRLQQVTNTPYDINDNPGTPVVTEYAYDPSGNRINKTTGSSATSYLIDPANLSGYSQVLQEATGSTVTSYILGGDVIGQAVGSADPEYLLYDGHGSVRSHAVSNGSLVWYDLPNYNYSTQYPTQDYTQFSYDAWGQECRRPMDEGLYYSGEMFDPTLKMYNLRARYYNPANGRFNQTDTYAGSSYDPQSLHKYLYCHADPVNGVDPSGQVFLNPTVLRWIDAVGALKVAQILLGIQVTYVLGDAYIQEVKSPVMDVDINRQIARFSDPDMNIYQWVAGFVLRPDIVDHSKRMVYEVKPDKFQKIIEGRRQLLGYIAMLDLRYPDRMYCPGTWQPRRSNYFVLSLPIFRNIGLLRIQAYNAGGGVIAYRYNTEDFRNLYFMVQAAGVAHMVGNAVMADMARAQSIPCRVSLQGLFGRGLF